jgi:predicted ester cyclase
MQDSIASIVQEANAAIVGAGDMSSIPRFFSADYVAHGTEGDPVRGHAAIQRTVERWHRAFPDMSAEVEILIEASDRVAWQRTLRATQEGAYAGFPATGRRLVWRDMVTSRFEGDLIAEEWVVSDLAEQLLRARKG